MIAKYDTVPIELSSRFIEALKEFMWAEMEMMKEFDSKNADCWIWGICEISDLASSRPLDFCYGGKDDKPTNFPKHSNIWIKIDNYDY